MRVEVKDISPGSAFKVGCLVHALVALVPGMAATVHYLMTNGGDILRPTYAGQIAAATYTTIVGALLVSIIAGAVTWFLVAVIYNLVATFAGGVTINLVKTRNLPARLPIAADPMIAPPAPLETDDGTEHVVIYASPPIPEPILVGERLQGLHAGEVVEYEKPVITTPVPERPPRYWEGRWRHK